MKVKRKLKSNSVTYKLGDVNKFIKEHRKFDSKKSPIRLLRRFLKEKYGEVFPEEKYPKLPLKLIKLRIGYELLRREYLILNKPVPEKVQQNINAFKNLDLENITSDLKFIIDNHEENY